MQNSNHPPTPIPPSPKKTTISHRGLCSIFPQNTKQAIIAGLHCSDLTEFDIILTKDEEIVVFHDRYLSRITDVADLGHFADRRKEEAIDDYGEVRQDWWVRDFTVGELRQLRVYQPVTYRPQFDMRFQISTLEEIIQESLKITNKPIHKCLKTGLLIQIKQQIAGSLTARDLTLLTKLTQLLQKYNLHTMSGCQQNNLSILIQSFNIPLLSHLQNCENTIIQLYDKDVQITEEFLVRNGSGMGMRNVGGIGVTQGSLVDGDGRGVGTVGGICRKLGYQLFYWTIRDDDLNSLPFHCKTYHEVYLKLSEIGVTGFITQFPDKCKGALKIESTTYSKGNAETETAHHLHPNPNPTTSTEDPCQKSRKISECESMDSSTQDNTQKNLINN